MHYIKQIFENKINEHTKSKFLRYSQGEFVGTLLKVEKNKNDLKVESSFHIIDELLNVISKEIGNKKVEVKGTLTYNEDLRDKLEENGIKYPKITKSRGIFNYKLDNEVELEKFIKNMKNYNLIISFKHKDIKFISKTKLPKPNKEISDKFCKAVLPISILNKIKKEFLFDIGKKEFKQIYISHKIRVDEIIFPKDKKMSFEEIRRKSKRKGEITREILFDKKEKIVSKKNFLI